MPSVKQPSVSVTQETSSQRDFLPQQPRLADLNKGAYKKYRGFNVDLQMFPQMPSPSDSTKTPKDLNKLFYGDDSSSMAGSMADSNENNRAASASAAAGVRRDPRDHAMKIEDSSSGVERPPFFDMSDFEIKPKKKK